MTTSVQDWNLYSAPGVFNDSYPLLTYVGLAIGIVYAGIFVILNNHYVFKPKVQKIIRYLGPKTSRNPLFKTDPDSKDKNNDGQQDILDSENQPSKITQFLLELTADVFTNLPAISFAFSTAFISHSHNCIQTFVCSDAIWMGFLGALTFYKMKDKPRQDFSFKFSLKNSFCLILVYVSIIIYYSMDYYTVAYPLTLLLIYLLNLFSNVFYQKLEQIVMAALFSDADEKPMDLQHLLKPRSIYPSPQTLATQYPCTAAEIAEADAAFALKRDNMKLKSKTLVYQKLHKLFTRIQISQKKYKDNEKLKTHYYIGRLNGTVSMEKYQTFLKKEQTLNPREASKNSLKFGQSSEAHSDEASDERIVDHREDSKIKVDNPPALLLYFFPIKMLENSEIISGVFSVAINLGFGFFLDYVIQVFLKLNIGALPCLILAIFMLPLLPGVEIQQVHNTLTIGSVFKYGTAGIILTVSSLNTASGNLYQSSLVPGDVVGGLQLGFLLYYILVVFWGQWQEYKLLSLGLLAIIGMQAYTLYGESAYFI